MKTVRTAKGTELPLLNLKGKDYLQVAHRIQWFTEEEKKFAIETEFLVLTDEQTVCRAHITTYNDEDQVIRKAMATKRETKKDFPDHTEKAETGSIGRALVELGYGTQFALSDLEEDMRLADSPVVDVKVRTTPATTETKTVLDAINDRVNKPVKPTSSFSSQRKKPAVTSDKAWV
jgi:hypothetical protein